jgi:pyridinium-3,5-biscarboxylic acid mononucleotide synthase
MNQETVKNLLMQVKAGEVPVEEALDKLKSLPYLDLGFAVVDTHRALRQGFPEVIMGEGKEPRDIVSIIEGLRKGGNTILVTRVDTGKARAVREALPEMTYNERARSLTLVEGEIRMRGRGAIIVVSAGTSDIPVAEEAAVVCELMGNLTERLWDVGVAGIHRLMNHVDRLRSANVLVVAAGMEGALPSVIGGIVERPVVAVPTSVGYGAGFGGLSALLGMLNSCAAGVCVVNIDNGFGAGYVASLINR